MHTGISLFSADVLLQAVPSVEHALQSYGVEGHPTRVQDELGVDAVQSLAHPVAIASTAQWLGRDTHTHTHTHTHIVTQ